MMQIGRVMSLGCVVVLIIHNVAGGERRGYYTLVAYGS